MPIIGQGPTTGSFIGQITDSNSGNGIPDATVTITNLANGFEVKTKTDSNGNFSRTGLPPGNYEIRVEASRYVTPNPKSQSLFATKSNDVVPVPFKLVPTVIMQPVAGNPQPSPSPESTPVDPNGGANGDDGDPDPNGRISLNPRREGAFGENEVRTLPLGSTTLTRTFDELALLIPGVAPPPQAIGNTVGPGVGGGVGTSGQFAVNGLRSRANNFTVDGSDNNDEDIGVRRQGFFSLVPQPIESIQQFTIITLLAPAEFGRNLGAQVNVNSKGGGNRFNGTLFALGNADFLNARNFFDNASGDTTFPLQATQTLLAGTRTVDVCLNPPFAATTCPDANKIRVTNDAGEKDVFSLLQGGFAVGGRIIRNKLFFFTSGEGQWLDATTEKHFAVPTVEERGFGGSGATGFFTSQGSTNFTSFPTSRNGDAVFSLFPFPNDSMGIYGRNTYTQALSGDAHGGIFSGRVDYNFNFFNNRPQVLTARYNFTNDKRDLTDVGGAIFSAIRPLVRTDNFSGFLTGGITEDITNELRFSWGRTRLRFDELPDTTGFLRPVSSSRITNPEERRFLLNAPILANTTIPTCTSDGCFASPFAIYRTFDLVTAPAAVLIGPIGGNPNPIRIEGIGEIGQLIIAGFSPVGVDVFNFPQQRVNDTFQFADTVRWNINQHSLAFGTDIRRIFLNSNLPRNSRPLVTFNGTVGNEIIGCAPFCPPLSLAAAGAASGFFQSLVLPGRNSEIDLGYYQLNFFAQDEWRVTPNLLISYGLRYEYNTTPKEADDKIESSFTDPQLDLVPALRQFIDGRTEIYDPDHNNFAPRLGIAAAITPKTVVRGGGGVYFDQIIGAVVSQSRNVFPTFTTVNFGGGVPTCFNNSGLVPCNTPGANRLLFFNLLNPRNTFLGSTPIIQNGTLNTFNIPNISLSNFLNAQSDVFPSSAFANMIRNSLIGATLPQKELDTPFSYQYYASIEQEIFNNTFLSAAYVGTTGRRLLRFTTPNLGNNYVAAVTGFDITGLFSSIVPQGVCLRFEPCVFGSTLDPTANPNGNVFAGRPVPNVGPISQFETTGRSQYHSLQIGLRGRLTRSFQYRANYVYGEVKDDVSDVFDLGGAFALPQNSLEPESEYAPANFDVRHRFTYSFIYDTPDFGNQNAVVQFLLGGWQIAGTGKFNTGQPFTVNSILDVNFDGNLTDRLNNLQFITVNDDRRQPLSRTCNPNTNNGCLAALARFGEDGSVPRNSFRAGSILELDLSFAKRFTVREQQNMEVRFDVFNFINRANFGIPVRILEFPGFGQATDTVTPGRRIQVGLKYNF